MRTSHPLHLVLGPVIWAAWFVVTYAGLSVACRLAPPLSSVGPFTGINGVLLVLTLLVTGVLLGLGYCCWRGSLDRISRNANQRFISRVSAGVYLLIAVSTLMIGIPVIALPPCI